MADASLAPLLAAIQGGNRRPGPLDRQRAFADSIIKQGADTSPVRSPLEGLARALTGAVGSGLAVYTDSQQKEKSKAGIDALAGAINAKTPEERAAFIGKLDPENEYTAPMLGNILSQQMADQNKIAAGQRAGDQFAAGYGAQPGMATGTPAPLGAGPALPQGQPVPGGFNNNLGNIRASAAPFADKGAPQNGFETFNTPQGGANAMVQNLQAYLKQNPNMTVAQAIQKWAPPNENDTNLYIRQVAEGTGINPGMPLGEVMRDPVVGAQLLDAITRKEKGGLPQGVNADTFVNATTPGAAPQGQPGGLTINMPGVPQGSADPSGNPIPPQSVAPPAIPDVPRPQPNPQLLQSLRYKIQTNQMTPQQAEQELQTQVNQEWQVQRERAKMQYEQQGKEYDFNRKQGVEAPKETFNQEGKLRDDFNGIQSVKDYRKAATVFKSAVEAAKTDSAAADLNMVYAFATLMDPGSVVRDSETGMVLATQNASDKVKSMVASVTGGQRISPEARQNLLREMGTRYDAYKSAHDNIAETFRGIASRSGGNPDNVIIGTPDVPYERMPATSARGTAAPAQGAPGGAQEYDYVPGKGLVPRR